MPLPHAVEKQRQRLADKFVLVALLKNLKDPAELEAEYARYLCVLACGFLEKAVAEIIVGYASSRTARPVLSFIESSVRRLGNLDKERLLSVVGSLDAGWRTELDAFIVDEKKEALNSVVGLRHNIAHGGDGRISLGQVQKYWVQIQAIVEKVADLITSAPTISGRSGDRQRRRVGRS